MGTCHRLPGGDKRHKRKGPPPLEGYGQGALRRRNFKTLKVDEDLTGEIVNEVGWRIVSYTPQIAFLDSTFLSKVAPLVGADSKCRRQFWTSTIGADAGSKTGIAKKVAVAPHYVPGHWCSAPADLGSG